MSDEATKAPRAPGTAEIDLVARSIVDAALEVHRAIGPGYLESVYEEALAHELSLRGIGFVRQPAIEIGYKGHRVGQGRLDFLVGGCVIVELKAVDAIADLHVAQALSYLRATGLRLALLINFNTPLLKRGIRRVAL